MRTKIFCLCGSAPAAPPIAIHCMIYIIVNVFDMPVKVLAIYARIWLEALKCAHSLGVIYGQNLT